MDYTQAHINCPLYNITFEGSLNGTFTVKNQVFSANKFISYELTSTYVLVLTLRVPKSIQECFGLGTTQNYSFSLYVNDASSSSIIELTYGTDSSGTGYTYIAGADGAPDTLTAYGSQLTYAYSDSNGNSTISNQDIVQLTVVPLRNEVAFITLRFPPSSISGFLGFYSALLPASLSTIYLSNLTMWPLYFDYTSSIVTVQGVTFGGLEYSITNIGYLYIERNTPSLSFTIDFQNAAQPNAYIIMDTNSIGALLDVSITYYSSSTAAASTNYVYIDDINTNGYTITLVNTSSTPQKSNTKLIYSDTSGWQLDS